ncbi:MAG TPA: hypothetical protein VFU72_05460, partial [Nitrolancea sp.]|nr:hypothetical protein [Nitrolancea sp.]
FGRDRRYINGSAPTTADMREERERAWAERFPGPSSLEDYRRGFLRYSPLFWDIVQSSQHDLLRLLTGRVPAELGVPAIFGLTVLFGRHPKADAATRAALGMIVNELQPGQARTLLVSLADAWQNAERRPYDQRGPQVADEFERALRRLALSQAEDDGVISTLNTLVGADERED